MTATNAWYNQYQCLYSGNVLPTTVALEDNLEEYVDDPCPIIEIRLDQMSGYDSGISQMSLGERIASSRPILDELKSQTDEEGEYHGKSHQFTRMMMEEMMADALHSSVRKPWIDNTISNIQFLTGVDNGCSIMFRFSHPVLLSRAMCVVDAFLRVQMDARFIGMLGLEPDSIAKFPLRGSIFGDSWIECIFPHTEYDEDGNASIEHIVIPEFSSFPI